MAKKFEKKKTDTKEIKKREKIIGGFKTAGSLLLAVGVGILGVATKGKFKGPKV